MTRLLEKAFSKVSELPDEAQDEFARWLLEELAAEHRWSGLVERSAEALSKLADEALSEHHRGETQNLDPSKL